MKYQSTIKIGCGMDGIFAQFDSIKECQADFSNGSYVSGPFGIMGIFEITTYADTPREAELNGKKIAEEKIHSIRPNAVYKWNREPVMNGYVFGPVAVQEIAGFKTMNAFESSNQ